MWEIFLFASMGGLFGILLYELVEGVEHGRHRLEDRYHE
jgi:hypothetical protein